MTYRFAGASNMVLLFVVCFICNFSHFLAIVVVIASNGADYLFARCLQKKGLCFRLVVCYNGGARLQDSKSYNFSDKKHCFPLFILSSCNVW